MGAGRVCLQRPGCSLIVRVGREEEGVSSLRSELAAIARTLQATPVESDLLYLCDSEASQQDVVMDREWSTYYDRRGCKRRYNDVHHRVCKSASPKRSTNIANIYG
jgi:hypothetical protein